MTLEPLETAGLAVAFLGIALVYASVGFGGGSAYTALLALAGASPAAIPVVSLACNLVVAAGGALQFARRGHLGRLRVWPLLLASAPAAYLAGRYPLDPAAYLLLLGLALAAAAVLLWLRGAADDQAAPRPMPDRAAVGVGAGLGALSGLTGIGGGIYLSPLLMLRRWAAPREAAAAAAVFIAVNSLFGLAGQLTKPGARDHAALIVPLGLAVLLGGSVGSRLGAGVFAPSLVRRGTAALAALVAARLLARSVPLLLAGGVP